MSENKIQENPSRLRDGRSLARTIEYCLIVSAVTVAGLLILEGFDKSVIAPGESSTPLSNYLPDTIAALTDFGR